MERARRAAETAAEKGGKAVKERSWAAKQRAARLPTDRENVLVRAKDFQSKLKNSERSD